MTSWRLALFALGVVGLTVGIGALNVVSARILRSWEPDFNLLLHPLQLGSYAVLGLACAGLGWASGLPPGQLGWHSADPAGDCILGIITGLLVPLLLNPLLVRAVERWGPAVYSPAVMRGILPRRKSEWFGLPLGLLVAVFLEEMLFRSLWIGGLSVFAPAGLLAFISAGIFGFMHISQGRAGMVAGGLLGTLFAGLFLWRGSLLPSLVAHYLINMIQVLYAHRHREWLERYPPFTMGENDGNVGGGS